MLSSGDPRHNSWVAALEHKLQSLPDSPGVYLHQDEVGRVLYVGKASNLRQRVRSYFQPRAQHSRRIDWLVSRVRDVEVFLVNSPLEALILECNLIKKHRPYFNVKYRDDKRYPLIEITTSEPFPRIKVVRQPRRRDHRYFGPYPDAGALRRTLKVVQKLFQVRTCKLDMAKVAERPCLDYHIRLCTAPCTRYVESHSYATQVECAIEFLEGRSDKLLARLRSEMKASAERLEFEACARIRDAIADVERVVEKQHVVSANSHQNEDYVGLVAEDRTVGVHLLMVRGGKLVDQRSFVLDSPGEAPAEEQMSAFLKEHYSLPLQLPTRILVSVLPEDAKVLETWLTQRAQRKIKISEPQRGGRVRLLELALKNARHHLQTQSIRHAAQLSEGRRLALTELRAALGLRVEPVRIECVDISNSQGKEAVGSLVVFEHGQPQKDEYRRFRIRTGDSPDDFRMMHEVLSRRFAATGSSARYRGLPDLLIVDGGKGQLGSALRALSELGLSDIVPVVGLAKQHEWLFRPGNSEPLVLDRLSQALALVTHLRDEAHRFALAYHRKLRSRASQGSELDGFPGLGPVKKQSLLEHFGSLRQLKKARAEEIAQVPGFGMKTALRLHQYLHA